MKLNIENPPRNIRSQRCISLRNRVDHNSQIPFKDYSVKTKFSSKLNCTYFFSKLIRIFLTILWLGGNIFSLCFHLIHKLNDHQFRKIIFQKLSFLFSCFEIYSQRLNLYGSYLHGASILLLKGVPCLLCFSCIDNSWKKMCRLLPVEWS